jgi:hypothetical protein
MGADVDVGRVYVTKYLLVLAVGFPMRARTI